VSLPKDAPREPDQEREQYSSGKKTSLNQSIAKTFFITPLKRCYAGWKIIPRQGEKRHSIVGEETKPKERKKGPEPTEKEVLSVGRKKITTFRRGLSQSGGKGNESAFSE